MGKNAMEIRIMKEVEGFLGKICQFNETPFDIADICHVSASNIICSVVFGKRYDYSDEHFTRLSGSVVEMFKNPDTFGLTMFLPWLRYLQGDPLSTKDILKSVSKIADHCRRELEAHKESFDENNIRDVFDDLIHRQMRETGNDRIFSGGCIPCTK